MKPSGYCGLLRQARVLINNLMVGSGNLGWEVGLVGVFVWQGGPGQVLHEGHKQAAMRTPWSSRWLKVARKL